MSFVWLMLGDLRRSLLVLASWHATVRAIDHFRNLAWVNVSREHWFLDVSVYAVIATLNSFRFETSVLFAHRAGPNARASDC